MTTLIAPSFERRILQAMTDSVNAQPVHTWPKKSYELSLDILRSMRKNDPRQLLEEVLSSGVEAKFFSRECGPVLAVVDEIVNVLERLIGRLLTEKDSKSKSLVEELRLVEQKYQPVRELLAEALNRAAEAPRPVDWERVRASEEAYERGETKPFSRQ